MMKKKICFGLVCCILLTGFLFAQAKQVKTKFKESWNYYQGQVRQGVGYEGRLKTLDTILKKYKNSGINLSRVKRERNFVESLKFYKTQVDAGLPTGERIATLSIIKAKYKNAGVDLSDIDRELNKAMFTDSWNYYQKQTDKGEPLETRIGTLNRILSKYKDTGIDLLKVEEELKRISGQDVQSNFSIDWQSYQELIATGASFDEKIQKLEMIKSKYQDNTSIDLSKVNTELERNSALKTQTESYYKNK